MAQLNDIAIKYGCDKSNIHHDYCKIYEQYLSKYISHPIHFVEIGYGGYNDPDAGGESARMWTEYLPEADFVSIDLCYKNVIEGIWFIQSDQADINLSLHPMVINANVIIDDGSHMNTHIINTFKNLFPTLAPGGLYFVEDLHSSYDPFYPDSGEVPGAQGTAMEFFTRIAHDLNKDFIKPEYHLGYDIEFVHFYRELVVIKKK